MTCEELQPEYLSYALGIADDLERLEIARHLEQECPHCVPGVRKAMQTVAAMSGAVKLVEPPRGLRNRVVGMVSPGGRSRKAWNPTILPWAVAFALAVALVVVELPRPRDTAEARIEEALAILSDPAARDVSFGQPAARGRVFVSAERGVVFIAAGLPHLEPHRTFELWAIPAAGNPIPAGTFRSQADEAVYVHPGPVTGAAAFAVTIEPEGGSPQPTTTPFIVAKL